MIVVSDFLSSWTPAPPVATTEPLTVTALSALIRETLQNRFSGTLTVIGEVSGLQRAQSGHVYFSLKEGAQALIRCTLWRSRAARQSWLPQNGDQVIVEAELTTYEPNSTYQLDVRAIRPAGIGAWWQQFLQVKARLEAEGLFAAERKRALPRYPRRVAIITSPQADALQDVRRTLASRAPMIELFLFPAQVQGTAAPASLLAALQQVIAQHQTLGLELVMIVRGGGSPEDLAAFNDETLARAIAACPLPVITGIGHETDHSIADFVADVRAPTPTGAAAHIAHEWQVAAQTVATLAQRLARAWKHLWHNHWQQWDHIALRLKHLRPHLRVVEAQRQVAVLHHRLNDAWQRRRLMHERQLNALAARLRHPREQLQQLRERLDTLQWRLVQGKPSLAQAQAQLAALTARWQRLLAERPALRVAEQRLVTQRMRWQRLLADPPPLRLAKQRLAPLVARLEALSPRAVLARGYALVLDAQGKLIPRASALSQQQPVRLQFYDGQAEAHIDRVEH